MRKVAAGIAGVALVAAAGAVAEVAPDEVKVEDFAIAESLTGQPGDPVKGREWAMGRKLGNCLACHENSDMSEQQFHGEVGPPLDGAGSRWSAEQLRAIVVNSKAIFGDQTIMPAFYRVSGLNRPLDTFEGKTILTAQQVEDVVAYLMTLKDE